LPLEKLATTLLAVTPAEVSVNDAVKGLRGLDIPVICRVQEDRLLFDPRTLFDDELELVAESIRSVIG
jgi:L-seryl-tRNA(Ser) seleniumtransferase